MLRYIQITIAIGLLILDSNLLLANEQATVILQKESIRRQELALRSNKQVAEAQALFAEGKIQEASELIEKILKTVPKGGPGDQIHKQASRLKAAIKAKEMNEMLEKKEWFKARALAKEIIALDPEQAAAYQAIEEIDKILGFENDKPTNPAVDERFINNLNSISALLKRGDDLIATGQYEEAEKVLNRVLSIDPYNKVATKNLEKIYKSINQAMQIGRKNKQIEKVNLVRKGWSQQRDLDILEQASDKIAPQPIARSNKFKINNKLKSITIPELNFRNASIEDAISYLKQQSQIHDPEGEGVDFVLKSQGAQAAGSFSINLKDIPISEALRYITTLAGMKYRVEAYAVFVVPLDERSEVLVSRDFVVAPSFFEVQPEKEEETTRSRRSRRSRSESRTTVLSDADKVKKSLEQKGVDFPEGAAAIYNLSRGVLTVKNTQDQIDLVEELVSVESSSDNLLVKVEARFVEINQEDLESLTNNIAVQGNFVGLDELGLLSTSGQRTGTKLGDVEARTNMLGIRNFLQNSLDRQISATSAAATLGAGGFDTTPTNRVGVYGSVAGQELGYLLDMLDQKKSTDLMTAPSIVVNNSAKGVIRIVREFIYPTEFDPPQIQQSIGGTEDESGDVSFEVAPSTVIPSWPLTFESQDVGVNMSVIPQITADRKRVLVVVQPEVVEFDGFINYGTPINDVRETESITDVLDFGVFGVILSQSSTSIALANENEINQPVFSIRRISDARLEIEDGHTMVLAGLIREDVDLVDEKIPLLGDLPLVGRAFRSKAERSIKRHLMIFVSVRILRPDGQPYNVDV